MEIAFLMDRLESIDPTNETTSHLMYECNQRGHTVYFLEPHDDTSGGTRWWRVCAMSPSNKISPWETTGAP